MIEKSSHLVTLSGNRMLVAVCGARQKGIECFMQTDYTQDKKRAIYKELKGQI